MTLRICSDAAELGSHIHPHNPHQSSLWLSWIPTCLVQEFKSREEGWQVLVSVTLSILSLFSHTCVSPLVLALGSELLAEEQIRMSKFGGEPGWEEGALGKTALKEEFNGLV